MEAGPRNRPQQPDGRGDGQRDAIKSPTHDGPVPFGPDGAAPEPLGEPAGPASLDGSDGPEQAVEGGESFRELRPPRRLRIWQLAPIVGLAILGSLMFAFPLAFEFGGDGGAVISMLGLLLFGCAAGWGMMAARRVGHTWPGLPARGSGRRPDWRVVLAYAVVVAVLALLAVWRVARLH
ncbi:hypothetical protein ADK76_03275 [Streptomyces griseoflavus]|uniref:hypothetical protein n=1 Tax=Streptomyces rimosus TaxID=1927 RepID=UPI0004CBAAF7|nr:hypothetical protein [Streptomyces rimosus]KOG66238.1 hypothetical protein ADK76_03275 [Streptomyces griseoflavus]